MASRKSPSPAKKKPQSKPQRTRTEKTAAGGPLPPYGVAIREAIARGDVREMRQVAAQSRKWLKETQAALDAMEKSLSDLEGQDSART